MKMFSDCSGKCCVCACGNGCLAGHGDDGFIPAKKDQIIENLNKNKYQNDREYMIKYLKEYFNYDYVEKDETLKQYHASGMTLIDGSWQSCGWTIEAHSFVEAAQIAENDETFRLHSLSDNVLY